MSQKLMPQRRIDFIPLDDFLYFHPLCTICSPLDYGLRLKRYRHRACLTQSQLAAYLEVSKNTISSIERGEFYPSFPLACKIDYFYAVVDDYFYHNKED